MRSGKMTGFGRRGFGHGRGGQRGRGRGVRGGGVGSFRGRGRLPGSRGGSVPGSHPVPDCCYEEFGVPSPHYVSKRGRGPHRGNHAGNTGSKKVDKRDLPENNAFYCEVCDRGYKQEEKFKAHVEQHIKCHFDNCTYVASPKLVKLHIEFQHRTGLAKKIWALESKEDIQKWRNERKRNFPTAENIAKKKAAYDSRVARGELIETKQFGKMRGRGRGRGRGGRNDRFSGKRRWGDHGYPTNCDQMKNDPSQEPDVKKVRTDVDSVKPLEGKKHDPALDPLSYVLEENDSDEEEKPADVSAKPLQLCGGLGSLISSYGDITDSDEDEAPVGITKGNPALASVAEKVPSPTEKQKVWDRDGDKKSVPPTTPTVKEERPFRQPQKLQSNRTRKGREIYNRSQPTWTRARTSTLLEKLLAPEIRHERNVILQCVRYIVNNNFFGVGQTRDANEGNSDQEHVSADIKKNVEEQIMDSDGNDCDNSLERKPLTVVDEDIWESVPVTM